MEMNPCYAALGQRQSERGERYARFVQESICERELSLIRNAVRRNQLTGEGRFTEEVERRIGRRIALRGPGRPRGSTEERRRASGK